MPYKNLQDCIDDLEKHGHLIRIKEEVDPYLEMAAIHLRIHEAKGKAILFEKIKGCEFQAVSNLFGTLERSKFLFRDTIEDVKKLIALKSNPLEAIKHPIKNLGVGLAALNALPKKVSFDSLGFVETTIDKLPQVQCWEKDGGAFVTLPLVYSEDIDKPGVMNSNLGMYRIQLSGNEYVMNKEVGLHYQLHRGIGVHQTKSNAKGQPLKVSVFVGGTPAQIFSAVMPLPEGMSELTFAGVLGGRRFRYAYKDGYCISADADFVITGEVYPNENKPEGPFGDHLGYYSLKHDFPVMRVHKVWRKKNPIWAFTVVGRPPQEDTSFGALIHEITGDAISQEIPGLHEVHAVDAAGVHPLLLAIGSERYTPYLDKSVVSSSENGENKKDNISPHLRGGARGGVKKPQEILTIANHILGTGQMSLAKYVFITSKEDKPNLSAHDVKDYFKHVLERVDWTRDLHFYTRTTIDTLDYSGTDLNSGSKVVIAAAGDKKRELGTTLPDFNLPEGFPNPKLVMPGVLALQVSNLKFDVSSFSSLITHHSSLLSNFPLIVLCDDSNFVSENLNNFIWVTFTRSNPSHDIYGIDSFTENKHWGCKGSLIIDARIKSHHAPPLEKNADVEKKIDAIIKKLAT